MQFLRLSILSISTKKIQRLVRSTVHKCRDYGALINIDQSITKEKGINLDFKQLIVSKSNKGLKWLRT